MHKLMLIFIAYIENSCTFAPQNFALNRISI